MGSVPEQSRQQVPWNAINSRLQDSRPQGQGFVTPEAKPPNTRHVWIRRRSNPQPPVHSTVSLPGRAATIEMVRRRQHEIFESDGTPRRRADVENQVFASGSRLAQPDDSHLRTHWPAPEDDCTFPAPRLRSHELDVKEMRRVRGFPPGYKCYNCKALGLECPDSQQYNKDCAVWQIFQSPWDRDRARGRKSVSEEKK
ncbi:hypothetical protein FALBO_11925 [Fusarium albosuccineum]|uniref:Uncharacterized protein n=1 Tax=Fusarium albosuccineum TaxID=1237068 RepID=A0A8H4L4B6_9HYPO|nr:hypothetical protein FALBO_11925 [Fusarium albosuccineum]